MYLVHALSNVLIGGTMARPRNATGRGEGATVERKKQEPKVEVPVHRLAEYVPASFTAASENENDPLNSEDARWYKTGDDKIMLVLGNEQQQFALEFGCDTMLHLIDRVKSMSITDVDDLLDLV